jgi:cell wall assembly regulator SMI1
MEEIWARIVTWMRENAPQLIEVLEVGASDAQIRALEEHLAVKLPDDFWDSYRIFNGQANLDYGLLDGCEFLSLERIQVEWDCWKMLFDDGTFHDETGQDQGCDPDPEICNAWWSPQWIPLTYDGAGNHACLDLAPTQAGTIGQIITMWHDDDERKVLASGIKAWLQAYAEGLESGQFVFSEAYGGIVNIDDI